MNVTGQPNASWRKEADDNSLRKRIMVRMYELLINEFTKNGIFGRMETKAVTILTHALLQVSVERSVQNDCSKRMMKQ